MNGPALLPSPFSCNEVCWQRALLTGGRVFGSEEFVGGGVYWLWYCSKSLFPSAYFSAPKMSACPMCQNIPDDYHPEKHGLLSYLWRRVRIF